ncbi:Rmf/CrpP family protein [uncultured Methylobacterium sp.]|jgi:ribosome modulation factor|uniref:ribosome modulation factor n=1 Tax=uncultured Methylobacterium sp. TaxID=157278 RepID=UPI00343D2DCB
MIMDVIMQGARARALGRPRDACPHPAESRERRAWYEGYDGSIWDFAKRVPHPVMASSDPAARSAADGSVQV